MLGKRNWRGARWADSASFKPGNLGYRKGHGAELSIQENQGLNPGQVPGSMCSVMSTHKGMQPRAPYCWSTVPSIVSKMLCSSLKINISLPALLIFFLLANSMFRSQLKLTQLCFNFSLKQQMISAPFWEKGKARTADL